MDMPITPEDWRNNPLLGSAMKDRLGAAADPSVSLKGAVMPPMPERDSESSRVAAMSANVSFAHSDSMTVLGSTGGSGSV
jgi:hypothetical protein